MTSIDDLNTQLAQLETRLGEAGTQLSGFDAGLQDVGQSLGTTSRDMAQLSRSFGSGVRRAFDGVVFDGLRLSDAMRQLGRSISETLYSAAMRPVQSAVGGALSSLVGSVMSSAMPFASGAAFSQGRVTPFAQGGIVSSPVSFPMRGGTGLMGEAGPEAIMPLTRGADGRLGVRSSGGSARPVNVVFNVSTPDVAGFQRLQSQIGTQMQRLLSQGRRNF